MCESYDLKQKRNKTWQMTVLIGQTHRLLAESSNKKTNNYTWVIVPRVCTKSRQSRPTSVMSHFSHV